MRLQKNSKVKQFWTKLLQVILIFLLMIVMSTSFVFGQTLGERKLELVVQTGHSDEVGSITFSPDGKTLASGDKDGIIKLWDIASGLEIRSLGESSLGVTAIAFSPDGRLLASGGNDSSVKLWNVETGKELVSLYGGSHSIVSVKFSRDGKILASASLTGVLKLWSTETGKELRTLVGHTDYVLFMTLSPDGKMIASGGFNQTIILWNIETGHAIKTFNGGLDTVSSASFSPNGKILALSSYYNNVIKLLDIETVKPIKTLRDHSERGSYVEFSPVENIFLTKSINYGIMLWNAETGKVIKTLASKDNNVISVAFSPDGKLIASGHLIDRSVKLWDVKTGNLLTTFEGHSDSVNSITFNQEETSLAFISGYTRIKAWHLNTTSMLDSFDIYDPATKLEIEKIFPRLFDIYDPEFGFPTKVYYETAESKNLIAKISANISIKLFKKDTGKELATLTVIDNNDWAVITPDGRFDGSESTLKLMHYSYGLEVINLEQLKEAYYEPGLLQKLLGYSKVPLRSIVPLKDVKLHPEIIEQSFDENTGKLNVKLRNRGGGIGKTEIFVNNKRVIEDVRDERLKQTPNVPLDQIVSLTVDLPASGFVAGKENKIKVITSNYLKEIGKGNIQSRGKETVYLAQGKDKQHLPNLYAIVGGVSDYDGDALDLRFAAKDAEDFSNALRLGANRLFCPSQTAECLDKVNITTLSTLREKAEEQPTKENFKKAFAAIARKAKPEDILVVYLSGHGVTLGTGTDTYFYLTGEARSVSREDLAKTFQTVTISNDELTDWLTPNLNNLNDIYIKALKQVIILDTCAAGNFAKDEWKTDKDLSGDQIRAMEFLSDKTGTFILMGSAANRPSYEANRYNQGLLTFSLLEGMKGLALQRTTGNIEVGLLFDYAANRVPNLAKEVSLQQTPIIKRPAGNPFVFGQMTETEKAKINLPKLKPMLLRPRLGSGVENDDPLNLVAELRKRFDAESSYETMKRRGKGEPVLIYIDDDNFPGAVRITGTYTIEDEQVRIKSFLRKDGKTVARLPEIYASKDKIIENLIAAIYLELAKSTK